MEHSTAHLVKWSTDCTPEPGGATGRPWGIVARERRREGLRVWPARLVWGRRFAVLDGSRGPLSRRRAEALALLGRHLANDQGALIDEERYLGQPRRSHCARPLGGSQHDITVAPQRARTVRTRQCHTLVDWTAIRHGSIFDRAEPSSLCAEAGSGLGAPVCGARPVPCNPAPACCGCRACGQPRGASHRHRRTVSGSRRRFPSVGQRVRPVSCEGLPGKAADHRGHRPRLTASSPDRLDAHERSSVVRFDRDGRVERAADPEKE